MTWARARTAAFVLLATVTFAVAALQQREADHRCHAEQSNRQALRGIVLRGRDVGKPGTPGYSYYQKHPEEARLALKRVDEALADLPPIHC